MFGFDILIVNNIVHLAVGKNVVVVSSLTGINCLAGNRSQGINILIVQRMWRAYLPNIRGTDITGALFAKTKTVPAGENISVLKVEVERLLVGVLNFPESGLVH